MNMKWLLCSALVCSAFSLQGSSHTQSSSNQKQQQQEAFDADLFKRDAQVFSIHTSFLFWRVQEGALDYALKMQSPAWSGSTPSYAQGKFEKATFNGEPGFRIAGSFFRAPNYWEVWGAYTRLTGAGQDSTSPTGEAREYLTGTWPQISTNPLASASSQIHLNYNVADLLVDRFFNPNPHLRLRLIGGALAAWMNQDWTIRYTDSVGNVTKVRNRWKYTGGGLRIGTMVDWFWTHDIYITGVGTTALLMGTYRNRAKQTTTFQPGGADTSAPVRNADYSDARPAFTIQASLGPSWQKNFPSTRVEVFAGYELNAWFNLQEVYRSTGDVPELAKETWMNTGMLALQGLTTRVTVDF